jgi:hypothetical protein
LTKLAEGGFNRTFVIALRGGRQVVARVLYPVTAPNYYAVASEVATIEYLRSCGIPAPGIYGYIRKTAFEFLHLFAPYHTLAKI